jgi:putative FmdB family regulatory protein
VPTYEYHCQDCSNNLEVFQKMTDPSLTVCPRCEGHLRKVFSPVGVVFKGSGFYATDSRSGRSTLLPGDKADKADKPEKADKAGAADTKPASADAKAPAAAPKEAKTAAKPADHALAA